MGVMLEGGKELIPAGDIVDIRYTFKIGDPSSEFYYPAVAKEGSLDKVKDRRDNMLDAVKLYEKALEKIPKEASQESAAPQRRVPHRLSPRPVGGGVWRHAEHGHGGPEGVQGKAPE